MQQQCSDRKLLDIMVKFCRKSFISHNGEDHQEDYICIHIMDTYMKNQGVFVKHYAPGGSKVQKAIFNFKVKVIDLGVIWKGAISGVYMPNMKSLSLTVQQLQGRLKLTTDRQTDRQTNKQTGQNNMPPIIRSRVMKNNFNVMQCTKVIKISMPYFWGAMFSYCTMIT